MSTFIPGIAPVSKINEGIELDPTDCLIVSSYKITPPIHDFILSDVKRVFLNINLFSGVEETLTLPNLLVIVPLLSSAASIPFPDETIFNTIEFNSDI